MKLGDLLDTLIEPFAPASAARRRAARIGLKALRQYDAARNDRRTQGWLRPSSSADREVYGGLIRLRDGARELVRNNKYAAAALRQMTAHMIGDGITARATHEDKAIASAAQAEWDSWSCAKVYEGRHDFFHVQKLVGRGLIESGEMLQLWKPKDGVPDSAVAVLEGDYLDITKTFRTANGKVVQGVEFNAEGERVNYHLFPEHPGDMIFGGANFASVPVPARDIDHIYEELRAGQTRGISWLSAVALTLRDVADIEDAVRLKKKVEACLALVLTRENSDTAPSPLTSETSPNVDSTRPDIETLRPGMIFRPKAGESATVVNPAGSADTVEFVRQQLAAVSASLVPYHLMTGDVSQANYSSLRAALLGFWAMLDDWQQQIVIPLCCQSAFDRRMRVLALKTGDARFLEVKASWAVPTRGFVDPVKDLMGEVLAIRAGLQTLTVSLAKRGIDVDKHLAEIARINGLIDTLQLALDCDPRRLTSAGILQAAAPYLFKPPADAASGDAATN